MVSHLRLCWGTVVTVSNSHFKAALRSSGSRGSSLPSAGLPEPYPWQKNCTKNEDNYIQRKPISRGSTAMCAIAERLEHKELVISSYLKHQETFLPAFFYLPIMLQSASVYGKKQNRLPKSCLQASSLSSVNSHLGSFT